MEECTSFRIAEAALVALSFLLVARATGDALVVQLVEMQGWRARRATEFSRSRAPPAIRVTRLAELRQWIVILRSEAFHAESTLEHRMGRTGRALERSLALARSAVVMTLLASEVRFEETLGTLRMALAPG